MEHAHVVSRALGLHDYCALARVLMLKDKVLLFRAF